MICALFHMYFFTLIKCLLKNDNRPHPISAALGTNSVRCSMVLQRIILQAPVAQVAESVLFGVPVPSGFLSMPKERSHVPQVSPVLLVPATTLAVLGTGLPFFMSSPRQLPCSSEHFPKVWTQVQHHDLMSGVVGRAGRLLNRHPLFVCIPISLLEMILVFPQVFSY